MMATYYITGTKFIEKDFHLIQETVANFRLRHLGWNDFSSKVTPLQIFPHEFFP